jgi:ADP-ribosyl-[dinitrogen reductase] hydrolase
MRLGQTFGRAFYHSAAVEEGCLLSANSGDDADTTGAIFGQIAGVYYGNGQTINK